MKAAKELRATCPKCGRSYRLTARGVLRKHWCVAPQPSVYASVAFADGGELKVIGTFRVLEMNQAERVLFSAIADAMQAFERTAKDGH